MGSPRRQVLSAMAGMLAVTAFFIMSSVAVVWANGLKFNPQTKRFEQTVVVAVKSQKSYDDASVFLNGEIKSSQVPFQLRGLLPGYYELLIKRTGYQPYVRTFHLSAGEVGLVEDFQPIALLPSVTIDAERTIFAEPAYETGLRITPDGELLDNDKLVTRFVDDPLLVRRFNNGYIYQLGSELRYFLPDGPQDYLVYTLSGNGPAKMNIYSWAWEIAVQDGEAVKIIDLITPAA